MTAEQLEELLGRIADPNNKDAASDMADLWRMAPSLARRVVAAEKLVEAASNAVMYLESGFINCGKCGDEVETKHTDAEYELRAALTEYREASK